RHHGPGPPGDRGDRLARAAVELVEADALRQEERQHGEEDGARGHGDDDGPRAGPAHHGGGDGDPEARGDEGRVRGPARPCILHLHLSDAKISTRIPRSTSSPLPLVAPRLRTVAGRRRAVCAPTASVVKPWMMQGAAAEGSIVRATLRALVHPKRLAAILA